MQFIKQMTDRTLKKGYVYMSNYRMRSGNLFSYVEQLN